MRLMRRSNIKWAIAAVLLAAVISAVSLQLVVLRAEAIGQGFSFYAHPSHQRGCTGIGSDGSRECVTVLFEENGQVVVGFSVRNTGSFPLTIESIERLGAPPLNALAVLDAYLPPEGELFSLENVRPFEPVELSSGEEATIMLMGRMIDCETARQHFSPGAGMGYSVVRMEVQWLLMSTEVMMPFEPEVHIRAPERGGCG